MCCAWHFWRSTMAVRTIDVRERVMARSDALAVEVRSRLRAARVPALNLVSSPGAGKTLLLERTLQDLGAELDLAVITGDVQTQNDADRLPPPPPPPHRPPGPGRCDARRLSPRRQPDPRRARRDRPRGSRSPLHRERREPRVPRQLGPRGKRQGRAVFRDRRRRQTSQVSGEFPAGRHGRAHEARPAALRPLSAGAGGRVRPAGQSRPSGPDDVRAHPGRAGAVVRLRPRAEPHPGAFVSAPAPVSQAARLRVSGVVQGVGFRPFVHRLALRHSLGGGVRNNAGEVEIEIEGTTAAIADFQTALEREAPPLARIERVEIESPGPPSRCPPTSRCARRASGSFSIPPTAASATRSLPAPTAGRASPSSRRCRTTGSAPACGSSRSARTATASITIPPAGAITVNRTAARGAARTSGSRVMRTPPRGGAGATRRLALPPGSCAPV